MKQSIFWIITFCLNLSIALTSVQASEPIVRLDGDRLTLTSDNQPLSSILRKLVEQGVKIRIDPRIDYTVNLSFQNRPLGSAMKRLLRPLNHTLIWEKYSQDDKDSMRLSEILIFYAGQENRARTIVPRRNLQVIQGSGGSYMVKDTLLIQLDTDMTEEAFSTLLAEFKAVPLNVHKASGVIQLRLPPGSDIEDIAAALIDYPGVRFVAPDYAYPENNSVPVEQIARQVVTTPETGPANVYPEGSTTIAVMDSGLMAEYSDRSFVHGVYDAISASSTAGDSLGHGTQMTLIAAGVVEPMGAEAGDRVEQNPVVVIRGLDDNGFTSNYSMILAIDYALHQDARVLSMSWGSESSNPLLQEAMNYATDNGLFLVAAAGNKPTGEPVYPAAYDNVIGVGALDAQGKLWEQSNYGDFVAVNAPGVADLPVGFQGMPGVYAGTSIATAYTARQVADVLSEFPNADMKEVLEKLSEEE